MSSSVTQKVINIEKEYDISPEGLINPFNKNNKLVTVNCIENILKKYNIYKNINNLELYQTALTHTSYTEEHIKNVCIRDNVQIVENPDGCVLLRKESYERMEFMGDTLLDAIIGEYVYTRFKLGNEGFLSLIKKKLINRWVIGDLAKIIGLSEYMLISKTLDDKNNARSDIKKCCDIFEAFIAAIYLDFNKDFDIVKTFVISVIEHPDSLLDITSYINEGDNPKTKLRNYVRRVKHTDVIYSVNEYLLDSEEIIYKCSIYLKNEIIGTGESKNSKESEFIAADNALNLIYSV